MSIKNTLRQLNVAADDYVYLNYTDSASVWHISDDYIDSALAETNTAEMLAGLLACPAKVTVLSRYDEDLLATMRDEGMLEDYDREGWFDDYLAEKIREEAYQYDLLAISTERHDHKRGTCEISSNVKVAAGELYEMGDPMADAFVGAYDVVVETANGSLTLN